ncbi:MAG TPA: transglutaminase domain-containing protein [Bacillota bacterium]|nr:transglutaminase domain-containing protein [Bacillota bacterium]
MVVKHWIGFRVGIIITILFLAFSPVFSAPGLYKDSGIGAFEFTVEFAMKNTGSGVAHSIHGEIPVMAWKGLPTYQIVKSVISDPPVVWNKDGHTVAFDIDSLSPRQTYRMNINYKIELSECFQDPPNQQVDSSYGTKAISKYLQAENGIEVGHPQMVEVINRLGLESDTPKDKARKIFAFVTDKLDYRMDFSRKAGALKALQTGWGRCEDYAMLFVALCRTAGVPARVAYGFRIEQGEMRGTHISLNDAGHAWAEAYLPGVGWISVDPTYIVLYKGKKVIDYRNFAGFYPDDIHIFTHYGDPTPSIYYERYTDNVKFEYAINFFISRAYN